MSPIATGRTTTKIALVGGAGGIGSSVAFNLLRTKTPYEIVVIDSRENMVVSHVMDLADALSLGGAVSIRGGTPTDASDADIIVVSASVPLRLNASRDEFLLDNANLLADIIDPLAVSGWAGVFVLMSNPIDPLLTWIHRRTGWDRRRLLGYSFNDTQRFRTGIATALDVPPQSVACAVVGEHGPSQILVWQSVTVDGLPRNLTEPQRIVVRDYVDTWYTRHVALDSGRTSTWSSGLGGALMIEAIVQGSPTPFPVSVVLDGEYGIEGVSSSTPALLGPCGLREVVELTLTVEDSGAFGAAAGRIAELAVQLP